MTVNEKLSPEEELRMKERIKRIRRDNEEHSGRERRDNEEHSERIRRDNEKHLANEKRQQEKHEKDMNGDPEFKVVQLALLGSLAQLVPLLHEVGNVMMTKYEFGDDSAIRAAACGLIKKAALVTDSPEAMREAATELLSILDSGNAKAKAKKAA
jgi:hypothetical protein